jgi:hypothetical protein
MKLQPERFEPTISVITKKMGDKISISVKDNGGASHKTLQIKSSNHFLPLNQPDKEPD